MAIQSKSTLKTYFQTGDKPTEENFADLIDSTMGQIDQTGEKGKTLGIGVNDVAIFFNNVAHTFEQLGVKDSNSAIANRDALNDAIDFLSSRGAVLTPTSQYEMRSGIILKPNVTISGPEHLHMKGTAPRNKAAFNPDASSPAPSVNPGVIPGGAVLICRDSDAPLIETDSHTGVKNLMFFYPNQAYESTNAAAAAGSGGIVPYPATLKRKTGITRQHRMENLTFVGSYTSMDFGGAGIPSGDYSYDYQIHNIYSFAFSGRNLLLAQIVDVPQISNIHIMPGVGMFRNYQPGSGGTVPSLEVMNWLSVAGQAAIEMQRVDYFMMRDIFIYGGTPVGFRFINSFGSLFNWGTEQVRNGVWATLSDNTITGQEKESRGRCGLHLSHGQGFPGAGGGTYVPGNFAAGGNAANRDFILLDGYKGIVELHAVHAALGYTTPVPSSVVQGANSFIKISGSGPQLTKIYGSGFFDTIPSLGLFAKSIDRVNTDSLVWDYGLKVYGSTTTQTETVRDESSVTPKVKNLEIADAPIIGTGTATYLSPLIKIGTQYYRIPLIPNTIFQDTFATGANNAALASRAPEVGAWTDTVAGWQTNGAGQAKSTNTTQVSTSTAAVSVNGTHVITLTLPTGAGINQFQYRIRVQDTNNFVRVILNRGTDGELQLYIDQVTAGAPDTAASQTGLMGISGDFTLTITANGTAISARINSLTLLNKIVASTSSDKIAINANNAGVLVNSIQVSPL